MPYGSMMHILPTNLLPQAAKQEPYEKAYLLTKHIEEFSRKCLEERTSRQKKIRQRVTGLGRRKREEIAKWNQMTALRFQTGGDIRHPRPPFGGYYRYHSYLSSFILETKTTLGATYQTSERERAQNSQKIRVT